MKPNSGIPLGQWSGADATEALHATIRDFNETASAQTVTMVRQTETMVRLTRWIVALTVILVIGLAVQIALAVA
jgi:hypothetical protein